MCMPTTSGFKSGASSSMQTSLRLATLAILLALALGCRKRERGEPVSSPAAGPVAVAPPDPKPVVPTEAPAKKEEPRFVYKKLPNAPSVTEKTPFTLDLKTAAPTATVDEKAGRVILSHSTHGPVGLVRSLPDGNLIVQYHNKLAALNPSTGELKNEIELKDVSEVHTLTIPRGGRRVVAVLRNTIGRHYVAGIDLSERKEVWRVHIRTGAARDRVTYSPDGRRGYVSPAYPLGRDGRTRSERIVFDPDTGKVIASNTSDDGTSVLIAYPDGIHMLGAGNSGMGVWDEKFTPVGPLVQLVTDKRPLWVFRSVVISPSGRLVAWCGIGRMVVASTETGEVRHYVSLLRDPGEPIISSDDHWLAVSHKTPDSGNTVHLIDLTTGREALRIVTSDTILHVDDAAFTADNSGLAVAINGSVYHFALPRAK
jgi:hypothetical protein